MNTKRIYLLSLVLLQPINLFSQSITYSYDTNGNRISRTLTAAKLVSNTLQFPVVDSKSLNTLENIYGSESSVSIGVEEESATDKMLTNENEIITLVYPNPTKGIIKIEISNMPLSSKNQLKLYDLYGIEKLEKRDFENSTEIDISHLRDGIYVLRIKINESKFDWKVIKSHD